MTARRLPTSLGAVLVSMMLALSAPSDTQAHPHVFVDGGVDFVVDDRGDLNTLLLTWRYDPFETLYVLRSKGIVPTPQGMLSAKDRTRLIAKESDWSADFKGAAHLPADGRPIALSRPKNFAAGLEDGRPTVRFRQDLDAPLALRQSPIEVALYEETYSYAFSVATAPRFNGRAGLCHRCQSFRRRRATATPDDDVGCVGPRGDAR